MQQRPIIRRNLQAVPEPSAETTPTPSSITGQNQSASGLAPLIPPKGPGLWSISEVEFALARPLPERMLSTRVQQGKTIYYIAWHTAVLALNKYAPGWEWEIQKLNFTDDRLFLAGRLTIPTSDGDVSREATGTELLKRTDFDGQSVELAYGDPTSNAESMAFRRAAAKFGLGLYLYRK